MAVKIRLRRMGRKQHPVYALVAADSRSSRDGRFIEDLGRYEPIAEPAVVRLNADRIVYWLGQGAQPSDTARNLLQKEGILLRSAMTRRGESAEAIDAAVAEHQERRATRASATPSRADQRKKQLEAERAAAAEIARQKAAERAEREAELQRQRDEADAAERAEREASRATEAEATEAAADAVAIEGSATEVIEAADQAVDAATDDAPAAEEAPAEEPAAAVDAPSDDAPAADEPVAEAPADEPVAEESTVETESPAEDAAADAPAEEAAAETPADETPAAETTEEAPADDAPAAETADATETTDAPADDLTRLHGVGPTYADILAGAGMGTFAAVAAASLDEIRAAIEAAGSTTAGNEETWAEQAAFLAAGDDAGFEAHVESLKAE